MAAPGSLGRGLSEEPRKLRPNADSVCVVVVSGYGNLGPITLQTPTTHESLLMSSSIDTSDMVTVAVVLEEGSDTAACASASVAAGIEPKPGMCPLLDVSLTGSAVAGQSPAAAAAAVAAAAATAPANGASLGPTRP